jgi:hypothetical protein
MDLILGKPAIAAKLEDRFGGRVCPMILGDKLSGSATGFVES